MVNALLYKFGNNLSDVNGEYRRGIVHRLDRNTSGLLMIAKNNNTHNYLAENIKEKKIEKRYYAIVKGVLDKDNFVINEKIGRNPKSPEKMCITADGKDSIIEVNVIQRFKDATLVDIHLITGTTFLNRLLRFAKTKFFITSEKKFQTE